MNINTALLIISEVSVTLKEIHLNKYDILSYNKEIL